MDDVLVVIDTSAIRPGCADEVRAQIGALVAFVEAKEDRPLAYHAYVDDTGEQLTVLQIHPDSASMELHMELAGPAFAPFAPLLQMQCVDVYGDASPELVARLEAKAELLGGAGVAVHTLTAGFTRRG
jgi:hypothetical protein